MKKERSELLALLEQRYKELGLEHAPAYRKPTPTPTSIATNLAAAQAHAQANKSDPFAGARMAHYLRLGLDNAGDVFAAARAILNARGTHGS